MAYRANAALATFIQTTINQLFVPRRGVWHTPEVRRLYNVAVAVCDAVYAMVYRAYAIRPYNFRKIIIARIFPNIPKTTSDIGKTTSYVEKIMSDII